MARVSGYIGRVQVTLKGGVDGQWSLTLGAERAARLGLHNYRTVFPAIIISVFLSGLALGDTYVYEP